MTAPTEARAIDALVAEMGAGLEGVTPELWCMRGPSIAPCGPSFDNIATVQVSNNPNWEKTAAHIARCSPDNIRAILDERDADKAQISALQAQVERLTRGFHKRGEALVEVKAQLAALKKESEA